MKSKKSHNYQKCDWCGKSPTKIHRRYHGEGYCVNCYKTWFILKTCSLCSEKSRLHKKEQNSICEKCKRKQLCIRCDKPALKDGSNTTYGRVCKSCYQNYFKEQKQCDICLQFNRKFIKDKQDPNKIICIVCYRHTVYKTCPECRKYRKLITTEIGELCKKCALDNKINCLRCNTIMSPSCGKYCWSCYWLNKAEHDIKLSSYLFNSKEVKAQYLDFNSWLALNYENNIASMRANKYLDFFIKCDDLWGEIPEYEILVNTFKPFGLRKNLVVVKWLCASKKIYINDVVKQEISELCRIDNLLEKFDRDIPICLNKYHLYLLEKLKAKKIILRTVRLALQPAVEIMFKNNLKNEEIINQKQINNYLAIKKGQKNTLSGFISFINESYGLELKCLINDNRSTKLKRKKYLEKELFKLNKHSELSAKNKVRWILLATEYFHNIVLKNKKYCYEVEGDFLVINFNFDSYTIPFPF